MNEMRKLNLLQGELVIAQRAEQLAMKKLIEFAHAYGTDPEIFQTLIEATQVAHDKTVAIFEAWKREASNFYGAR